MQNEFVHQKLFMLNLRPINHLVLEKLSFKISYLYHCCNGSNVQHEAIELEFYLQQLTKS